MSYDKCWRETCLLAAKSLGRQRMDKMIPQMDWEDSDAETRCLDRIAVKHHGWVFSRPASGSSPSPWSSHRHTKEDCNFDFMEHFYMQNVWYSLAFH